MFIFHIYRSFETEGHCRDQVDFYLLKTIVSFNRGKINMKKKTRITIIISPYKTCLSPSEMQKCNRIAFVMTRMPPRRLFLVHKWLPILLNAFDSILLYYRTVKRLLIPILQIRVRNGKLVLLFFNQNVCCGYLNGPIK